MSTKVHTDFTSDGKQLLKTIQDSQKEIEKLTNENRKLRDESKRAAKEAKDGFDDTADSIEDMASKLGLAQKATQLVTAAWDDWQKRVDKLKESQASFHEQLVNNLRASGQLARGDEIEKRLSAVPNATREQMQASFAGISSSGPVGVDRSLELAEAMAPRAQSGEAADRLKEFGGVLGEMNDIAQGRSAGDVADLTAKLQELTRGDFNKFGGAGSVRALGKMTQGGMAVEDALGFAAAAMDVGVDSKTLGQIAAKARAEGMTFDEAIANPKKAKLGDQLESSAALIDRDVAMRRADEFRQATQSDLINKPVDDLLSSQAGTAVAMKQVTDAAKDKSKALGAEATIEEIIDVLDEGWGANATMGYGYGDRTIAANAARIRTYRGDLPAEAAIAAYGYRDTEEYGSRKDVSDEERAFWREQMAMLRNLVKLQEAAAKAGKDKSPTIVPAGGDPESGR